MVTRELKLKVPHFVCTGGMPLADNRMLLIGNAKMVGENEGNRMFASQVVFNTRQLEMD